MKKFKFTGYEILLAFLMFLTVIGIGLYFYDITFLNLQSDNPFKDYDNNSGIITISIVSLLCALSFLVCFFVLAYEKYRNNKTILSVYLIAALLFAFLQWFQLYYGSTFYYGEVRDKQGLNFPLFASLLVTLVIWKVNYTSSKKHNYNLKVLLTALVNGGLYFLWTQVYELWNLGQS